MAHSAPVQIETHDNPQPAGVARLPMLWIGMGWLAGIALAERLPQPGLVWLAAAAILGAGLWLSRRADRRWRLALLAGLALSLGGARYRSHQPAFDSSFVASYNDLGPVTLEGVVADEPDIRDTHINLRLRAETLWLPEADAPLTVHGLVLVRAPRFPARGYGDRLLIYGQPETPPVFEDFSYAEYLARQGVYSMVGDPAITFVAARQGNPILQWLFDGKARGLNVLERIFPQPHAALLQGILLGVESGLPQGLRDAFNATGTSHIIAISGFNISLIAGLLVPLASRLLGERRGGVVAIGGIAVYTFLVGADAAVVRAAIMGGLALFARQVGRRSGGVVALLTAAVLMTLFNPLTLWDVGFQLSFAATLGLIVYAEPLTAAFVRLAGRFLSTERAQRAAALAGDMLLLTLAAQITTLPLIAYYFQRISLVSFLANLFIIPAQPAVMILGGLTVLLGMVWQPLGQIAAWVAWPFVAYTVALVEAFAAVPGASVELGDVALPVVAGLYAALFGATWLGSRPAESRPGWWQAVAPRWASTVATAGIALAALLVWQAALHRPDGRLHVIFLDVGDGEAILIETPAGRRVLIDGGESPSRLGEALDRRLPVWDRRLDWVVVAAPEDRHVAGLAGVLGRYQVGSVLLAGEPAKRFAYRELMQALADRRVPTTPAQAGQQLLLGGGATLDVLTVADSGAVLRVAHGRARFLLPIGLDLEMQARLLTQRLVEPASALLLADRDSRNLNTAEWVQAVSPSAVVLSASAGGAAQALTPEVAAALEGDRLLRTDRDGWVELAADGQRLWAWTER